MWKCPNCETLNNEETCAVCGTPRPEKIYSQQSQQSQQYTKPEKPVKKKNGANVVLIVAVIVFVIVTAAIAVVVANLAIESDNDESERVTAPTPMATQVVETPAPIETVEPTQSTTAPPQHEEVEDTPDILHIREIYNNTMAVLSECIVESDGRDGIKYYFYESYDNLVRVDVPADSEFDYDRNYYFDNGKLCFALVFKGMNNENRLYFKDDTLIRWKYNQEFTMDNAHDNSQYREWNIKVQKDATRFED